MLNVGGYCAFQQTQGDCPVGCKVCVAVSIFVSRVIEKFFCVHF